MSKTNQQRVDYVQSRIDEMQWPMEWTLFARADELGDVIVEATSKSGTETTKIKGYVFSHVGEPIISNRLLAFANILKGQRDGD